MKIRVELEPSEYDSEEMIKGYVEWLSHLFRLNAEYSPRERIKEWNIVISGNDFLHLNKGS